MDKEHPSDSKHPAPPVILVGVGGGIAAYKTVDVVSALTKAGAEVHVAMTEAAKKFEEPLTFQSITGHKVLASMFPSTPGDRMEDNFPHLYPATGADVFLLAPATANLMARIVHGEANDIVTTSVLSLPDHCVRIYCPSMNVEMWHNEQVQANARALEDAGWIRIGPESGALACGMVGEGRLTEPPVITREVLTALDRAGRFRGKRVLVLSGPTREHFDPVRYLGNPSTGKMGRALAQQAARAGAEVDFVTGPVAVADLPRGSRIHLHRVTSANEMLNRARALYANADLIIYAAAVSDYMPAESSDAKLPKKTEEITFRLKPTPDISATLNLEKQAHQVAIGFTLQTNDGRDEARNKLRDKFLDGIVLNHMEALGADHASFSFLSAAEQEFSNWEDISKSECARRILDEATSLLAKICKP